MILGMGYIGSDLYVFIDKGILIYDEDSHEDFDGVSTVPIDKLIETNPIPMDESYVTIKNIHMTYSSPVNLIVNTVIDEEESAIVIPSGENAHVEKRFPRNAKKTGLFFSFAIRYFGDTFSLRDMTIIATGAIRKALHRG